jgi:hypothetical protein
MVKLRVSYAPAFTGATSLAATVPFRRIVFEEVKPVPVMVAVDPTEPELGFIVEIDMVVAKVVEAVVLEPVTGGGADNVLHEVSETFCIADRVSGPTYPVAGTPCSR